jgi:hypothetical protein
MARRAVSLPICGGMESAPVAAKSSRCPLARLAPQSAQRRGMIATLCWLNQLLGDEVACEPDHYVGEAEQYSIVSC